MKWILSMLLAGMTMASLTLSAQPDNGHAEIANARLKYPAPSERDKQEIKKIIDASSAAYLTGDLHAILKDYSEQSIELFPNQVVNAGIGNIRSRLQEILNNGTYTRMDKTITSIDGAGPIALVWGKSESTFKQTSGGNISEFKRDEIFLFRKQQNGQWKILVHHWFTVSDAAGGQSSNDSLDVRRVIDQWSFFIRPGETLSQQHVENLGAIHSAQAVELYPNQRTNIGMANLRLRWSGFAGIKWAQFTGDVPDINSFVTIGAEGFARKAVAWGIGDHSNYAVGSDTISKFIFPWAMILSKEEDNQWRILLYHFYLE